MLITIDDEDLPDAVYVEGSLDADGSGSIVIIEDDDTGDTLGPDSERDVRRGIEPRMRERRDLRRRRLSAEPATQAMQHGLQVGPPGAGGARTMI